MGRVVKLNEEFVDIVSREAARNHRSVPKQIEFYYTLAAAALDNPGLSIDWVHDLLISKESGKAKPIKWIDEALVQAAGKQNVKKAAAKSTRARVASSSRGRKKSLSR